MRSPLSPPAYEEAFFYESGPYQDWLVGTLLAHLRLAERPKELRLADVGAGTGNFTAALAKAAGLVRRRCPLGMGPPRPQQRCAARRAVVFRKWLAYLPRFLPRPPSPAPGPLQAVSPLCVDFSDDMLALARKSAFPMEALCLDAEAFAALPAAQQSYDRLLLKEVVHHIAAPGVGPMYHGFFKQLRAGGVAVTVTRPQEVDYPLFEAARAVWRANQPPAELYTAAMEAAGFKARAGKRPKTHARPHARTHAGTQAGAGRSGDALPPPSSWAPLPPPPPRFRR